MVMYKYIAEKFRSRYNFNDDEIDEYQQKIDAFYFKWIKMCGRDGMSNYIHMLGAGHVEYFLRKNRNLYKYSQQG